MTWRPEPPVASVEHLVEAMKNSSKTGFCLGFKKNLLLWNSTLIQQLSCELFQSLFLVDVQFPNFILFLILFLPSQVPITFLPRDRGDYAQFWDLECHPVSEPQQKTRIRFQLCGTVRTHLFVLWSGNQTPYWEQMCFCRKGVAGGKLFTF